MGYARKAGSSSPSGDRLRSSQSGKKANKEKKEKKEKKESSREARRESRKEPKRSLKREGHVRLVEAVEAEAAEPMDVELGHALVGKRRAPPPAAQPPAGYHRGLATIAFVFLGMAGMASLVIVGKRAAMILHRPPPPPPAPAPPPAPPPPAAPSPSPPRPPPPPPPPPQPWRTPEVCEAVFAPESKFWRMWGTREAWRQSSAGDLPCWQAEGGADFFAAVARGDGCDRNWFEGAKGDLGLPDSRPTFAPDQPAGAVLGFDEDLYRYCSAAVNKQQWYDSRGTSEFNDELAHRCVNANVNILRLLSTRPGAGWSMCQNLRWQMCAVHGRLPGQKGDAALRFARAPSLLELGEWEHPSSYPCDTAGVCDGAYAVGDVCFAEACILQRVCVNQREVWGAPEARGVVCELEGDAVAELANDLRARAP
jgi:hypothetical protein